MNDFLELIAAAALSNALVATALGVVAWAASRWAKPTVAHALWLLVLVKLVTPPVFETRVPLPDVFALGDEYSAADAHIKVDPPARVFNSPTRTQLETTAVPNATSCVSEFEFDTMQISPNQPTVDETAFPATTVFVDEPDATSETPLWQSIEPASPSIEEPLPAEMAIAVLPAPAWEPQVVEPARDTSEVLATSATNQQVHAPRADATAEVAETSEIRSAAALFLTLWAAGAIAWFALAIVRIVRFRRALARAIPATPPLQSEVAALAAHIGLSRVPDVLVVPGQLSPLVCTPLCRAILVLPRDLLSRFSDEQRAAVIAHELAHLRRRDHWTRWLELLAVGCYWWLPTVWLARRQLHAAEEACCDAWVVWLLPERSRDYARALLETIDFLTPAPDAPLLASGFSRASNLKRRFDMILKQRASHRLSWPARVGIAATGLVILPWSLSVLSADETPNLLTAEKQNEPSAELPPAAGEPPSTTAPKALPSPAEPPSANNLPSAGSPPTGLPLTEPRRDDNAPSLTPSIGPPGASNAPPTLPPTQPGPGAAPRLPTPSLAPPSAAPVPTGPIPTPLAPKPPALSTDPRARYPSTPPTPERGDASPNDATVIARLERLEATTAELLAIVRQLRDDRYGPTVPRYDTADAPKETDFSVRYGHGSRQLDIKVAGRQVAATDVETGKTLWTTTMPFAVRAIQGSPGGLVVTGSNPSGSAYINPSNGEVKAAPITGEGKSYSTATENRPTPSSPYAPPTYPTSPTRAAVSPSASVDQIAKVEAEMLAAERSLAQQRAKLLHESRQLDTRRARIARKLDALTEEATAEERANLTAELEQAEDRAADMQFEVDTFEADLEFKIRELQLRRDQLLRALGNPFAAPSVDPQQSRPTSAAKVQR